MPEFTEYKNNENCDNLSDLRSKYLPMSFMNEYDVFG